MHILPIFGVFFRLGCISFGGPAAHIAYFEREFVQAKRWLSAEQYAQIVALCQFLPGPASSQVGFSIGLHRGGLGGALAAFLGFTLPSFLLMILLAVTASQFFEQSWFHGLMHGLKLLAVIVVVDAVWVMSQKFCKTQLSQAIAIATAAGLIVFPGVFTQIIALVGAALVGRFWLSATEGGATAPQAIAWPWIAVFGVCLLVPLLFDHPLAVLWADFYQAGTLVFGGGHVVLPLLQNSLGDQLSSDSLLLAYSAAQAVPGPMFTMASYMGANLWLENPLLGGAVATVAIFIPGFLLVLALQKSWLSLAAKPSLSAAVAGINASVVGLLLAALYSPIFVSAVKQPIDMACVLVGLYAMRCLNTPLIVMVSVSCLIGLFIG